MTGLCVRLRVRVCYTFVSRKAHTRRARERGEIYYCIQRAAAAAAEAVDPAVAAATAAVDDVRWSSEALCLSLSLAPHSNTYTARNKNAPVRPPETREVV